MPTDCWMKKANLSKVERNKMAKLVSLLVKTYGAKA
jgi:hypothetical protein